MADEIQRLRASLARMRPGNGRRYGSGLRDQISRAAKQLRAGGASWRAVGETLGMPLETVRRIHDEQEERTRGFVPIEIGPALPCGGIAVVTPGGYRVEGLDVETAVTMLARLA